MHEVNIVLADDHAILRNGLRQVLESVPQFRVVGETDNGKSAIGLVNLHRPDIAILDISMPEMSGIEAARLIKESAPDTRVLILTIHDEQEYVVQVMNAGADGYITKNSSPEDIIEAVRCVAAGREYLGRSVSKIIAQRFIDRIRERKNITSRRQPHLTNREIEILRLVAQGLTSKEISDKLFLSIRTVHSHRMNIMQKLNIHETAGLVTYAIRHGLVAVD